MNPLPPIIHESWHKILQPLFDDPKMELLKEAISQAPFYPSPNEVFRVFSMPIDKIKVVILGQDPYPNGEAIGLAFAIKEGTPTPASLKIIRKEVETSGTLLCLSQNTTGRTWSELQHWIDQGVFLLNTALTVQVGVSGSHMGYWQWFIRDVIKAISEKAKPMWMLWGSKAQAFKSYIDKHDTYRGRVDNISALNLVLEAPHPAAEKYSTTNKKFTGCNHFNICNEILTLKSEAPINW